MVYSCDIAYQVNIPKSLKLPHQGLGVVIGPGVIIGENCTIYQSVTIGAKDNGAGYKVPQIGNDTMIGCGSIILGDIRIGDNVSIGANSLVIQSVDNNMIAAGNPARIVKLKYTEEMK